MLLRILSNLMIISDAFLRSPRLAPPHMAPLHLIYIALHVSLEQPTLHLAYMSTRSRVSEVERLKEAYT